MAARSLVPPLATLALVLGPFSRGMAQEVTLRRETSTTAEVTVTGRVTTTTTETVQVPVAVVIQPEPSPGPSLSFRLLPRGELVLSSDLDGPAAGMSVLLGADAGDGWGGGLVVGYFGEIGFSRAPSEVHLALEAWRDFSPHDVIGFLLVARAGAAILVGDVPLGQAGGRPLAQLGIGTRVSFDPRIAMTLDLRGELRMRPAGFQGDGAPTPLALNGGLVITMGLAIALD